MKKSWNYSKASSSILYLGPQYQLTSVQESRYFVRLLAWRRRTFISSLLGDRRVQVFSHSDHVRPARRIEERRRGCERALKSFLKWMVSLAWYGRGPFSIAAAIDESLNGRKRRGTFTFFHTCATRRDSSAVVVNCRWEKTARHFSFFSCGSLIYPVYPVFRHRERNFWKPRSSHTPDSLSLSKTKLERVFLALVLSLKLARLRFEIRMKMEQTIHSNEPVIDLYSSLTSIAVPLK